MSPDEQDGAQLLLEPNAHPASSRYQKSLFEAGIPITSFEVSNTKKEYERLTALGVEFSTAPTEAGDTVIAVLNDTCGNMIQLYQA